MSPTLLASDGPRPYAAGAKGLKAEHFRSSCVYLADFDDPWCEQMVWGTPIKPQPRIHPCSCCKMAPVRTQATQDQLLKVRNCQTID